MIPGWDNGANISKQTIVFKQKAAGFTEVTEKAIPQFYDCGMAFDTIVLTQKYPDGWGDDTSLFSWLILIRLRFFLLTFQHCRGFFMDINADFAFC